MRSTLNSTPIRPSQIRCLIGKQVKGIALDGSTGLTVSFSDGTTLVAAVHAGRLSAEVNQDAARAINATDAPTKRQLDYLRFISKYIGRFGRSPAESDIERHFLVSAPSVNQMMQTLERRGFISRQQGVPRSIRIRIDLGPFGAD